MPDDSTIEAEAESDTKHSEFVAELSRRTAVLERLVEGPAAASAIASDRSIGVDSARSAGEELRERGLVELLVTDDERAYGLTADGERVLFALERKGEI